MAKLTRVFQNLFGLNGNQSHFGQFGSRAAAAPILTKDPSVIQALTAFTRDGWLDAINAGNKAPFLEDMNGLFYLLFYQVKYGLQEGIPEWDGSTEYFIGSIVKKTGTFELYGSLTNSNTGNALPSQTSNGFWQYLNPPSVAAGIVSDFGGVTVPFGYLACDGTAYAQATYPALFAAIGTTWDTYRGVAAPGAGNFRVPDYRGQTTMGVGQAPGLSLRTLAQFVGEEGHILTTAEMPAHDHPVTDPQHHHSGRFAGIYGAGAGLAPSTIGGTIQTITENAATGITVGNRGGGGSHNVMQPTAGVTKIIKT